MKREISTQLLVALGIVLLGAGILAGEYFLVKWYPRHQQRVQEEALKLLPYRNDSLGIEMQVAAGLYGEVENFPGGVRITRPKFWSIPPSLTITSQPNPDGTFEFSPQIMAKWQTQGTYEDIPRYHFEHTRINNRDAILIWQYKHRAMLLTVRVISSERLVEMYCTPGREDEELFMEACESTVHTLKVAGPEPPPPAPPVLELAPPAKRPKPAR
ncbi:MAG: hypothetical protein ABSA70_00280 [Terriglobia bacterium]